MVASQRGFEVVNAVVVMGVSGCGKTSVAQAAAQALGWRAVDADDLHTLESVAKMRSGQALNDVDRQPWLDRVGAVLADAAGQPSGVLVACSALRRRYRDHLRAACPGLRFVFLDGHRDLIGQRLAQRRGHYMPASLLDSQFQTLERPDPDEIDVLQLDIQAPLDVLIQTVLTALGQPPDAGAASGR